MVIWELKIKDGNIDKFIVRENGTFTTYEIDTIKEIGLRTTFR